MPAKGWKLPETMREEMKMPLGDVLTESEAVKAVKKCDRVISVGDVVSLALAQHGIQPHLMVFDRMTERMPMTLLDRHLENMPGMLVTVRNPPGFIKPEMVSAIDKALKSEQPTKLMVEGEEDLAGLVCAALAPDRSCLLYGLPKKGLCLVHVDKAVRENAKRLINNMEESE
ncbi:MAG TPA: DUF359 domain-containing protein [Methanomassiliicoccales archaeon]|nr:DUF359 domain-containing protein [Methanomassiliicoccales archaeon]